MNEHVFNGGAFDGPAPDEVTPPADPSPDGGGTFNGGGFNSDLFNGPPPAEAAPLPADLLEAVVAFLGAHDELTEAFGHADWLWSDEAATGTPLPGCDLFDVAEAPSYTTADGYFTEGQLQASIFAGGKAAARRLGDLVAAALADAPLAFAGGTLMNLLPGNRYTQLEPEPGPGNADVWQRIIMFDYMVSRSL